MLRASDQLSTARLVDNANSKSQEHLLAISQRRRLNADVVDVLVRRGDDEVVRSVARNTGARISETSFRKLIQRSETDTILALELGARRDIPRQHFQKLIARASEEIRHRLASLVPEATSDVLDAVAG